MLSARECRTEPTHPKIGRSLLAIRRAYSLRESFSSMSSRLSELKQCCLRLSPIPPPCSPEENCRGEERRTLRSFPSDLRLTLEGCRHLGEQRTPQFSSLGVRWDLVELGVIFYFVTNSYGLEFEGVCWVRRIEERRRRSSLTGSRE